MITGKPGVHKQGRALGKDIEMFNLDRTLQSTLAGKYTKIVHCNVLLTCTSFFARPADAGMGMVNLSWCSDIGVITFFLILVRMDLKSWPSP